MDLNSFDYYFTVIYWWAIERARSLYVEDCLVPPSYKAALGSVSTSWQSAPFPPTRFLETYFNRQPSWHFLDLMAVADRVLVYVALLLAARTNAYVLEYVPKSWLYRLSAATSDQPPATSSSTPTPASSTTMAASRSSTSTASTSAPPAA
jgi:hypothetical protein